MIDAKDLRLKNIVQVNGIIGKVDWIQKESISVTYFERQENIINGIITHEEKLQPIPLTPDVLEKCGFEKWGKDGYDKNGIYISKYFNYPIYNPFGEYINSIGVKYLHDLQNLYYSLTKQELNYTP